MKIIKILDGEKYLALTSEEVDKLSHVVWQMYDDENGGINKEIIKSIKDQWKPKYSKELIDFLNKFIKISIDMEE